jgi:hypothetical protein
MRYIFIVLIAQFTVAQKLTPQQANHLASLPLKCLQQEYPNKPGETLIGITEVVNPKKSHPAFYGCFDWHSSVHGHWSLVYLLNHFPTLENRDEIVRKLQVNLSKENIAAEVAYMTKKHEKSFERTYGWNWLLKLQHELEKSSEPYAKQLAQKLKPLSDLVAARYIEFLPKLLYPIRVGTHSSTAFGLTFAWDYAIWSKNEALQKSISEAAVRLFQNDQNCPLAWEPSGTDFLSPCLEEVGIMQRVLPDAQFLSWLQKFAPQLFNKDFNWEVGKVSDRTDGHLVHLDGLNFSRAWNFYRLIKQYPNQFAHLKPLADTHMNASLPMVVDGNYEGEHWLASFALHAYEER